MLNNTFTLRRAAHGLALTLLSSALLGCAGYRETYVVMPDANGKAGSLSIAAKEGNTLKLEGAYANAKSSRSGAKPSDLSAKEITTTFSEALSARPDQPVRFTLYFQEGTDELTAESKKELEKVLNVVKQRAVPDIFVIGHTDRVGQVKDNDRLALRRAEKMRLELLNLGLAADSVQAAGRGEREPLVPTADEVAEPRNRRVEMLVR